MTAMGWVYFLAASILSMLGAFLFAWQISGSKLRRMAGAVKQGVEAFLRRHIKTAATLLGFEELYSLPQKT